MREPAEPVSPRESRPAVSARWWLLVHAAVTAVVVGVLCAPRQLVLMDGGLHLSSAAAVRGLAAGRWTDLLTWKVVVAPNLLVEVLTFGLATWLDGDVVVRGVAILLVLGFSAAVLGLARAVGAPLWTATLALPFAANVALMAGLLGFAAATVLAVVTVAAALADLRRPRAVIASLLVLTWFTHLIPALSAAVAVALVLLVRGGLRQAASVGGSGLLAVALLTGAFALTGGSDGGVASGWFGGGARAADLTKAVASWSRWEYQIIRPLTVLLLVVVVLALAVRLRRWRTRGAPLLLPADGVLAAAAVLGALAVVTPETIGSVSLTATRLAVLPPVLLTAWVGAQVGPRGTFAVRGERRTRVGRAGVVLVTVTTVAAALVTVGLGAARVGPLTAEGERLAEVRSTAACAPRGGTIVQLNADDGHDRAVTLRPDTSFVGYVADDAGLLDLGNVSGTASYYVWAYTDRARAVPALAPSQDALETAPPEVDLLAAVRSGFPLDSVLVVGTPDPTDAGWAPTGRALSATFRPVATTPAGSLWVRQGITSGC